MGGYDQAGGPLQGYGHAAGLHHTGNAFGTFCIARLASTHTALVSQSLVGLCFAFLSIFLRFVGERDASWHYLAHL